MAKLFYNTIPVVTRDVLRKIMVADSIANFRLVGGTALVLQLGHRRSSDLELYTDAKFGSIDFNAIASFIRREFPYFSPGAAVSPDEGKSWFAGNNEFDCAKIDFYYTEPFAEPALLADGIRMANMPEITAMKIDAVQRRPTKADFWDIHELLQKFTLDEMTALHKRKYSFDHNRTKLLQGLTLFQHCNDDFEPVCLRNKAWPLIKLDLLEVVNAVLQPA